MGRAGEGKPLEGMVLEQYGGHCYNIQGGCQERPAQGESRTGEAAWRDGARTVLRGTVTIFNRLPRDTGAGGELNREILWDGWC